MYLALESPMAVDIAYLIHRVTSDSYTFKEDSAKGKNRDYNDDHHYTGGSSSTTTSLKGSGIGVTPTPSTQNSPESGPFSPPKRSKDKR